MDRCPLLPLRPLDFWLYYFLLGNFSSDLAAVTMSDACESIAGRKWVVRREMRKRSFDFYNNVVEIGKE